MPFTVDIQTLDSSEAMSIHSPGKAMIGRIEVATGVTIRIGRVKTNLSRRPLGMVGKKPSEKAKLIHQESAETETHHA